MKAIAVGDPVVIKEDGKDVHGVVESIQVKANLIDVRIHEKGNRRHCLIVAFHPDDLFVLKEKEVEEEKPEEEDAHPHKRGKAHSA